MTEEKTPLEQYISTPSFKNHKKKCIYLYDKQEQYIDDAIQNFCLYYLLRPEKKPNIRKLYSSVIDLIRKDKKYIYFDMNKIENMIDNILDDNILQ